MSMSSKLVGYGFVCLGSYAFKRLFFDKHLNKHIPVAISVSLIALLYITWFVYFSPFVFHMSMYSALLLVATLFSWYNFYMVNGSDPGVLHSSADEKKVVLLKLVEQNEFSIEQFCSSCIIHKPLRSKHCADCDRCVAKFDHHCPWVDNCIGQLNLKYFIGFLFWTQVCLVFYMHGAFKCKSTHTHFVFNYY